MKEKFLSSPLLTTFPLKERMLIYGAMGSPGVDSKGLRNRLFATPFATYVS
jgi:hypothetical protein